MYVKLQLKAVEKGKQNYIFPGIKVWIKHKAFPAAHKLKVS